MKIETALFTTFCVAGLAQFSAAQTWVDTTSSGINNGINSPGGYFAEKFTTPAGPVRSIDQVGIVALAGSAPDSLVVTLWSHDSVNNEPDTQIATLGTVSGIGASAVTYSTSVSPAVNVNPSTTYHIVFQDDGSSTSLALTSSVIGSNTFTIDSSQLKASVDSGSTWVDSGFGASELLWTISSSAPVNNPPAFTANGPFSIVENSAATTLIGDVQANDGDGGASDANVTYSIFAGNTGNVFSIDSDDGEIRVNGALDHENINSYTLTVRADDSNSTTDASVTVNVTDVDEDPVFTASGPFTIGEDAAVNDTVGDVQANDGDGGATDTGVTYSITSSTPAGAPFTINSGSGMISTNGALDFEGTSSYDLTVQATDGVNPVSTTVTVNVTDVDEDPVFTASGPFTIGEDAAVNDTVGDVQANDGDGGATDTGVTYSITSSTPAGAPFTINSGSGVISTNGALDFEGTSSYDLTVQATDGVNPVSTTVTVNVTDVDEDPVFTASGPFAIGEDAAVNDTVGDVQANDGDGGATDTGVTYSITSSTPAGAPFTINSGSGVISTNGALDFEGTSSYDLTVQATDGVNPVSTTVTVNVTDVDEDPVFTASGPFAIGEDAAINDTVGDVQANDGDGGATDTGVTYSITSSTPAGAPFTINSGSGIIATNGALDFEGTSSYDLTVQATDGVNPVSTTVTVNVSDENDAPTAILLSSNVVDEADGAGTVIGVLSTTDQDGSDTFTYTLLSDSSGKLDVVGDTVQVGNAGNLTSAESPVTIEVQSVDSGSLGTSETFMVTVTNNTSVIDWTLLDY